MSAEKELARLGDFPCTGCGLCCQIQGVIKTLGPLSGVSKEQAELAASLDRGDGTCRNYDEESRKCKVYDDRPYLCRVKEQAADSPAPRAVYLTFLRGCRQLQLSVDTPPHLLITEETISRYLR